MRRVKSPFRYPGGKSRLADRIVDLLIQGSAVHDRYIEPFVGGGAVALTVAQRHPSLALHLNDSDSRVISLWRVLSIDDDGPYKELVRRLEATLPSVDLWTTEKSAGYEGGLVDLAFRALFLNRCTFSGNMSLSAGGPIGGYDQSGKWKIDARWKLELLLPGLDLVRDLLTARTVVLKCGSWQEMAWMAGYHYYDPPYVTDSARSLYSSYFTVDDHIELRQHLRVLSYPWVLSYDNDQQGYIKWLYSFAQRSEIDHSTRVQRAGPVDRIEVLYWHH